MNEFEVCHGCILYFCSTKGWDGYAADPVLPKTKENVKRVWEEYKLIDKEYELEIDTLGHVHLKVKSLHGLLELLVDQTGYCAEIKDGDKTIMPLFTVSF